MTNPASSQYQILGYDAAQKEDERFWTAATVPSLAQLLRNCEYGEEQQAAHLDWYQQFVPRALGPRPIPGQKALFTPCPVFDGSACEHSINWKEKSSSRLVRFTMEATGYEAGTSEDPFNQTASGIMLRSMLDKVPGLSLQRFGIFANSLFVSAEKCAEVLSKVPDGLPLSQMWLAFDLRHDGGIMAKVYFMPILKWIETGIPTNDLVFDTIRKCNDHGSFDNSITYFDNYIKSFTAAPEDAPRVEMVAIDCIDSPEARIKVYLRTAVNTLARAKHMLSLGGALRGEEMDAGIAALTKLWPILFRLDETDQDALDHYEVFPQGSYCGCAIEMKPGVDRPETKLHIPVRKIDGTDVQICESLSAWFQRRGHGEFAARYKQDLEAAFPGHDLGHTRGTHTFISFSYTQRTGVYMTMYYSTKILDVHAPNFSKPQEQWSEKDIWAGYDNLWRRKVQLSTV